MIALITLQELQGLTAQQLGELHQFFTSLLAEPVFDEAERRVIRATLENIERTMGYAGETDATRLHNIALANIIGHGLASPNQNPQTKRIQTLQENELPQSCLGTNGA